jgi:hypothetical protein
MLGQARTPRLGSARPTTVPYTYPELLGGTGSAVATVGETRVLALLRLGVQFEL